MLVERERYVNGIWFIDLIDVCYGIDICYSSYGYYGDANYIWRRGTIQMGVMKKVALVLILLATLALVCVVAYNILQTSNPRNLLASVTCLSDLLYRRSIFAYDYYCYIKSQR